MKTETKKEKLRLQLALSDDALFGTITSPHPMLLDDILMEHFTETEEKIKLRRLLLDMYSQEKPRIKKHL